MGVRTSTEDGVSLLSAVVGVQRSAVGIVTLRLLEFPLLSE